MTRRNFLRMVLAAPLLAVLPKSTNAAPVQYVSSYEGCTFTHPITVFTNMPMQITECTFISDGKWPMLMVEPLRGGGK